MEFYPVERIFKVQYTADENIKWRGAYCIYTWHYSLREILNARRIFSRKSEYRVLETISRSRINWVFICNSILPAKSKVISIASPSGIVCIYMKVHTPEYEVGQIGGR